MPYRLSATLKAHTSDVRAVNSPTNDMILSASRDSTAISWQKSSLHPNFTPETVIRASTRYVNAVAYISPTSDAPKGYVVTGGQDAIINVFSLSSPKEDPDFSLLGHSENVCALDVTPGGTIVSGSWDRTARVWKNFNLAYELKGHELSVWAVLAVDEEQILTGSADKTIRLWNQHKLISTFRGHQDAVRGLALIPDLGFASCSNDSEIRVWTLGGDLIYSLSGHTSFVYSLSILPSGGIVSGGEDRSVRVWKDGECSQVLVHPAISVWSVSTMPNGDIVSGCSDGVVRVFTEVEDRWASPEDLKAYDDMVASQALPSQQVGDIKKSDLAGTEALNAPGKKPGDTKMIRNGDIVEVYQWDADNTTWQRVGEVVDAVGQGRKQLYQGKEYDYVFDVDIQDGVPPLKLPYNVTENPFTAAQRFLQTNDLPLSYIDQVVNFIEKNTAGVKLGSNEEYVDPFTGASRYRSGGNSVQTTNLGPSTYVDPYTGASRYSGNSAAPSAVPPASSEYMDPFTGASRYSGAPPSNPPTSASPKRIPMAAWTLYKPANVPLMRQKTFEVDGRLRDEISTSSLAMYPQELASLEETFAYLTHITDPKSSNSNLPTPTASNVDAIIQIIQRWPSAALYPVFDLSRLVAAFCPGAFDTPALKSRFIQALITAGEWSSTWNLPLQKSREINLTLALKALANMFQEGTKLDEPWVNEVLSALSLLPYEVLSKVQRTCLATILFNISCTQHSSSLDTPQRQRFFELALQNLKNERADSETVYRTLFAVGNALYTMKSSGNLLEPSQNQVLVKTLPSISQTFGSEARVQDLTGEVASLL
ncbi:phospholipase A-2-activating protein [Lentinula novae-zelandiae]|nr:phospholipase A-2-activating protein [Lentinula novae-zelandiae]